jgi:hypothetical protein
MKKIRFRWCRSGLRSGACSFSWSPATRTLLSPDTAEAKVGRPLTATSVAGVSRRVHRREYRRAATGAAVGAAAVGTAAGADVGVPVPAPEQADVGVLPPVSEQADVGAPPPATQPQPPGPAIAPYAALISPSLFLPMFLPSAWPKWPRTSLGANANRLKADAVGNIQLARGAFCA